MLCVKKGIHHLLYIRIIVQKLIKEDLRNMDTPKVITYLVSGSANDTLYVSP